MKPRPLNFISALSILLLVAVSRSSAQTPQRDDRPRAASIGGQVTIGGQPAANITVKIVEIDSRADMEFFGTSRATVMSKPGSFKAVTDAGGRYQLGGLAAGSYQVSAASKAYVLANQSSDVEPARRITLDGDEAREDVDLSLARGGVITGRVTTFDGRPMIATRLWLYAVIRQGDRTEYKTCTDQYAEMFETDDRGDYRVYGLPAGRYVVGAGGGDIVAVDDPASVYRRTYFRDATSGNKAAIIEVKEGGEILDVDIRLGAMKKTYEASGRLIEAETGKPMPQAQVWANGYEKGDEEEGAPHDTRRSSRSTGAVTDNRGNFRLTGLTPGRYEVAYSASRRDIEYYSDSTAFEIVNDNVEGLEIKARRASTISGVAVIEGAVDPNLRTLLFTPDAINIDTVQVAQNSRSISRTPVTGIQPNGEFRVSVSQRGSGWKVYFVANQWKVKGLRVSRVELNGVEAPDGIDVNPGQQIAGARVVFTKASGAIRGQVKLIGALPENAEPTVVVTSSPEGIASSRDRDSTEAGVDGKGRFVFDALFPGEYEVRAYLRFRIDRQTIQTSGFESPTMRVTVTNGQGTQVELTIDLSKMNQGKRQ
jgi:hypothetical protein